MTNCDDLIQDWKKIRVKGRKSITGSFAIEVDLSNIYLRGIEDSHFEEYCNLYTSREVQNYSKSFDFVNPVLNTAKAVNFLFLEKRVGMIYGGNFIKRYYYKFLNTTTSKIYWFSESMVLKELLRKPQD